MYFEDTLYYFATITPPIILGIIIWQSDRFKEPGHLLIASFLLGCAIDIPLGLFINIAEDIIGPLLGLEVWNKATYGISEDAFQNFFRAAFLEESIKFAILIFICTRLAALNEPMDAVIYASAIGLGYPTMENIGYLEAAPFLGVPEWTMVKGRLYPLVMHFGFAVIMGLFLSQNIFVERNVFKRRVMIILALLVPVMYHGIYNFKRGWDVFPILTLIFIIGIYYYLRREQEVKITESEDKAVIEGTDIFYSYAATLGLVVIIVSSILFTTLFTN